MARVTREQMKDAVAKKRSAKKEVVKLDVRDALERQAAKASSRSAFVRAMERRAEELAAELPFKVGSCILIRTVTMTVVGRVTALSRDFIHLEGGGWAPDTGRLHEALAHGTLAEFDPTPSWALVSRAAIVDVWPWNHPLPTTPK